MWLDINKLFFCFVVLNIGIGQRQFSVNFKEKLKNKLNRKIKLVLNINCLLLCVVCMILVSLVDNEWVNGIGFKVCQRICSDFIVIESFFSLVLYFQGSKCV